MKSFVIIKTGSTFLSIQQQFGNFEDWMIEGCGLSADEIPIINVMAGEDLPAVDSLSGVIMTGSPAMVTDQEDWMSSLSGWIAQVVERNVPLLGICFGHQLLAQAMGGEVDYHPEGREIGTVAINLTEEGRQDSLLGYLPETFTAHVTHAQTVTRLPPNALRGWQEIRMKPIMLFVWATAPGASNFIPNSRRTLCTLTSENMPTCCANRAMISTL